MVLKIDLLYAHAYVRSWQYVSPIRPHQKKKFAKCSLRTYSRWQIALILVVCSSSMTYTNMVSVPAEKHMYIWYTSPLILPVVPTCLTLRGQRCIHYKNVFTSCRRGLQDIPRPPRPRCAVVASCMIDMQPLPYNRDCPQASLILGGQVWDSHHPVGENLPSYIFIGASLQNSKLHKINTKSKSQLACHLLRLL
jgi:hypothetical protein